MMKKAIILFFALFFLNAEGYSIIEAEHSKDELRDFGDLGGLFLPVLTKVRDQLIEQGYDTYDLSKHYQITNEKLELDLDLLTEGAITGILNFDIEIHVYINIIGGGYKFKYVLNFHEVHIDINSYKLKAWLGLTKLFGDGQLSVKASFKAKNDKYGHMAVSSGGKEISIKDITVQIVPESFEFKITGWLNDDVRSEYISTMINNLIPPVFQLYESKINEQVSDIVMKALKGKKFPGPF